MVTRLLCRPVSDYRCLAPRSRRQCLPLWLIGAMLLAGFADNTAAQSVRKWVDAEGVTHYSDQPPSSAAAPVEKIEVPRSEEPQFDSEQVTNRILQQAEQFERERRQREREAAENDERRAIEEALQREEIFAAPKKKKKRRKSRTARTPDLVTPILNNQK